MIMAVYRICFCLFYCAKLQIFIKPHCYALLPYYQSQSIGVRKFLKAILNDYQHNLFKQRVLKIWG